MKSKVLPQGALGYIINHTDTKIEVGLPVFSWVYADYLFQNILFSHKFLSIPVWALNLDVKDVLTTAVVFRHKIY